MKKKGKGQIISLLMLLLATVIWGAAFVAQQAGTVLPFFTFNSSRSLIAAAVLLPAALFSRNRDRKEGRHYSTKVQVTGGIVCGILLAVATTCQQAGMTVNAGDPANVSKAGFITALYIVIVPILGIFFGHRPGWPHWIGVCMAGAGLYMLSVSGGFAVAPGDLLLMGCALAFSFHILILSRIANRVNGMLLSFTQFLVTGVLTGIGALIFDRASWSDILGVIWPLLYMGVVSSGVAYTLQIFAQKALDPTVATLVMSLESVFAALFGFLLLNETLTPRELAGCCLVFGAVLLAQFADPIKAFLEKKFKRQ